MKKGLRITGGDGDETQTGGEAPAEETTETEGSDGEGAEE